MNVKITMIGIFAFCSIAAIFLAIVIDLSIMVKQNTKTLTSIDSRLKADNAIKKAKEKIEAQNAIEEAKNRD